MICGDQLGALTAKADMGGTLPPSLTCTPAKTVTLVLTLWQDADMLAQLRLMGSSLGQDASTETQGCSPNGCSPARDSRGSNLLCRITAAGRGFTDTTQGFTPRQACCSGPTNVVQEMSRQTTCIEVRGRHLHDLPLGCGVGARLAALRLSCRLSAVKGTMGEQLAERQSIIAPVSSISRLYIIRYQIGASFSESSHHYACTQPGTRRQRQQTCPALSCNMHHSRTQEQEHCTRGKLPSVKDAHRGVSCCHCHLVGACLQASIAKDLCRQAAAVFELKDNTYWPCMHALPRRGFRRRP